MIVAILNYHSSIITIMVKDDNVLRNLLKQLLFSSRQAFLLSKMAWITA